MSISAVEVAEALRRGYLLHAGAQRGKDRLDLCKVVAEGGAGVGVHGGGAVVKGHNGCGCGGCAVQQHLRDHVRGLNAEVCIINAVAEERAVEGEGVVCANLPYNVTTPVLTALIESGEFDTITVMIQREVARRICAPANTPDYGAFGIFVQWYMTCELLFDVAPGCFIPQPKVTSSVIRLTRRAEKPYPVRDEALFFRIVRAAFNQRRKTLVNALSAGLGLDKADIEHAVTACGLDARVRGEALDAGQFVSICEKISDL